MSLLSYSLFQYQYSKWHLILIATRCSLLIFQIWHFLIGNFKQKFICYDWLQSYFWILIELQECLGFSFLVTDRHSFLINLIIKYMYEVDDIRFVKDRKWFMGYAYHKLCVKRLNRIINKGIIMWCKLYFWYCLKCVRIEKRVNKVADYVNYFIRIFSWHYLCMIFYWIKWLIW